MDVDIIFKIAAIGIAIALLNQILIKAGERRAGHAYDSGRGDNRTHAHNPDGE